MEFRRVLFRSWDRRKTVNLGNPNLLGIFRRPTPENALFALSEGRANPIVTTICFALSAAASGPLEVIRPRPAGKYRSEEHTSELQSLMRISYAVFCLKKKKQIRQDQNKTSPKP